MAKRYVTIDRKPGQAPTVRNEQGQTISGGTPQPGSQAAEAMAINERRKVERYIEYRRYGETGEVSPEQSKKIRAEAQAIIDQRNNTYRREQQRQEIIQAAERQAQNPISGGGMANAASDNGKVSFMDINTGQPRAAPQNQQSLYDQIMLDRMNPSSYLREQPQVNPYNYPAPQRSQNISETMIRQPAPYEQTHQGVALMPARIDAANPSDPALITSINRQSRVTQDLPVFQRADELNRVGQLKQSQKGLLAATPYFVASYGLGAIEGVYNTIRHPIQTTILGTFNAISSPIKTWQTTKQAFQSNPSKFLGELSGQYAVLSAAPKVFKPIAKAVDKKIIEPMQYKYNFGSFSKSIYERKTPYVNFEDVSGTSPQRTLFGKAIPQEKIKFLRSDIDTQTIVSSKSVMTETGMVKTGSVEYNSLKPSGNIDFLQADKQTPLIPKKVEALDLYKDRYITITSKNAGQIVDQGRYAFRVVEPQLLNKKPKLFEIIRIDRSKQQPLETFGIKEPIGKTRPSTKVYDAFGREIKMYRAVSRQKSISSSRFLENEPLKNAYSSQKGRLETQFTDKESLSKSDYLQTRPKRATIQYADELISKPATLTKSRLRIVGETYKLSTLLVSRNKQEYQPIAQVQGVFRTNKFSILTGITSKRMKDTATGQKKKVGTIDIPDIDTGTISITTPDTKTQTDTDIGQDYVRLPKGDYDFPNLPKDTGSPFPDYPMPKPTEIPPIRLFFDSKNNESSEEPVRKKKRKKVKQSKGYSPTFNAVVFGITGKAGKYATMSGLGQRPIRLTPTRKRY